MGGYIKKLAPFLTHPILSEIRNLFQELDCYLVDLYLLKFRLGWIKEKTS